MGLCVVVNTAGSEIYLSENHELAVANLISINNLYFLDIMKNLLIRVTIIKKSNYRQR